MLTSPSSASSFTTIFGTSAATSILSTDPSMPTPHNWTADSTGLYHTGADLGAEWKNYYHEMLAGRAGSLTDIQRLEGNAEAIFENTALGGLDAASQARDREDVQRQFDAMAAAMKLAGLSNAKPLTQQGYMLVNQTIQSNATLNELFLQGHGLNNSGIARYAGYTGDSQNIADTTRFVGGGVVGQGSLAVSAFLDDVVMSHIGFSVVSTLGNLMQLNQNGAPETPLLNAIVGLNDAMCYRVYTSADFAQTGPTAATDMGSHAIEWAVKDLKRLGELQAAAAAPASAGHVKTLYGFEIANKFAFNLGNGVSHTWVADSTGEFQTTSDLAAEWKAAYKVLLTNGGKGLNAEQRVEANAEAFFENTGLSKLSDAQQAACRADVQRQLDAEFIAMRQAGVNPEAPLTASAYLATSRALNANAALNELALQGHGLDKPPASRYAGFTNDFQNALGDKTVINGLGTLDGKAALSTIFDLIVMGHSPFPVVVINGQLQQLEQNGWAAYDLKTAVIMEDYILHSAVFRPTNFRKL